MVSSLISLFKELQDENGGLIISRNSNQFSSLKVICFSCRSFFWKILCNYFFIVQELAKRFALSFGLDALKNREAITALHREGVLFAVSETFDDPASAPPNLPFLEILMEFTNKLLKQDKRMMWETFEIILQGRTFAQFLIIANCVFSDWIIWIEEFHVECHRVKEKIGSLCCYIVTVFCTANPINLYRQLEERTLARRKKVIFIFMLLATERKTHSVRCKNVEKMVDRKWKRKDESILGETWGDGSLKS